MDSRKILEIYKRINDRNIKPVSAFPSIADIPPGALVLDSDGVVKIKVADELLTIGEFAVLLVYNGDAVTCNGQAVLVDDYQQLVLGANGFALGVNNTVLGG